jgi:hypothetical protein
MGASNPPQSKPTSRSSRAYLYVIALGGIVGCFLGMPLYANKNEWGLVVVLIVPLLSLATWGLIQHRRKAVKPIEAALASDEKRISGRLALALVALLAGPLGGAVAGFVENVVFDVHPLDRGPTIASLTILGTIAGIIVASAVALSAALLTTSRHP